MKKKVRDSCGTDRRACPKKQELPRTRQEADKAEVDEAANVRYFLNALNQMSLALRALGYAAEGTALVKVEADLNNRLFRSADKPAHSDRLLH